MDQETQVTPPRNNNVNRKIILAFYLLSGIVAILCTLPSFSLQNLGYIIIFFLLIAVYIARAAWPKDESLEENHSTYIIRTIWIYSVIAAFGMAGAGIIIGQQGNPAALQGMIDAMSTGLQPSEEETKTWLIQYFIDNQALITHTSLIWMSPAQLYLLLRSVKGFARAQKNYRIANIKSFF